MKHLLLQGTCYKRSLLAEGFIIKGAMGILKMWRYFIYGKSFPSILGARTVVSGLVPYMSEEDLNGNLVVLVCNMKPTNMRGSS